MIQSIQLFSSEFWKELKVWLRGTIGFGSPLIYAGLVYLMALGLNQALNLHNVYLSVLITNTICSAIIMLVIANTKTYYEKYIHNLFVAYFVTLNTLGFLSTTVFLIIELIIEIVKR